MRLPPFPKDIAFNFGAAGNSGRVPVRLRYKLEGYDSSWREGHGEMYMAIRFLNKSLEQITRTSWNLTGDCPGWTGDLASASLNHRREVVTVPAGASHIQVVITSAGPPAIRVSSHTRHHLTLAVKEAVHNVIKHARASELTLRSAWRGGVLTVTVTVCARMIPTAARSVPPSPRMGTSSGFIAARRL